VASTPMSSAPPTRRRCRRAEPTSGALTAMQDDLSLCLAGWSGQTRKRGTIRRQAL
jgi:hypothetical protein